MPNNEMTRFDREEVFKHSALRDCTKKLGVSAKLTCDGNVSFLLFVQKV